MGGNDNPICLQHYSEKGLQNKSTRFNKGRIFFFRAGSVQFMILKIGN